MTLNLYPILFQRPNIHYEIKIPLNFACPLGIIPVERAGVDKENALIKVKAGWNKIPKILLVI